MSEVASTGQEYENAALGERSNYAAQNEETIVSGFHQLNDIPNPVHKDTNIHSERIALRLRLQ
jgi:hypothetical protein